MYGYIALWNGKQTEVYADSLYAAQCAAVEVFQRDTRRKVKGSDVRVVLCERPDGSAVVHVADF